MAEIIQRELFGENGEVIGYEYGGRLVRCGECKWWKSNDCQNDTHGYVPLDENDFCSQGKRKDGAK